MANKKKTCWLEVSLKVSLSDVGKVFLLAQDFYGEQNKNGWLNQKTKRKVFLVAQEFYGEKKKLAQPKKQKKSFFHGRGTLRKVSRSRGNTLTFLLKVLYIVL